MNRRDLLLATTGALASAAAGSAFAKAGGGLVPPPVIGSGGASLGAACALIPVLSEPGAGFTLTEVCVKRFYPNQVDSANRLEYLTLDLQLLDDRSQLQTVLAWQLVRRSSASWSGGFRMGLTNQPVNLVVNLRKRGSRTTESWVTRMVSGGDSLLVTQRTSTGRPPSVTDLRLDVTKQELTLADGSQCDFDALLLSGI